MTEEQFKDYTDLIEPEEHGIPMHGVKMLVFMDDEARTWIRWTTTGSPSLNELLAMFTRAAFLIQMEDAADGFVVVEEEDGEDESL